MSNPSAIISPDDYTIIQTHSLDEANLALACLTQTAPGPVSTTTASTAASTVASTSVSSESTGADLVSWDDGMDWQNLDIGLMTTDMAEATYLNHSDRVDVGPSLAAAGPRLTDVMKAELWDTPTLPGHSLPLC
jgi:hypothetical protein